MIRFRDKTRRALFGAVVALLTATGCAHAGSTEVFLVRHAEKLTSGSDPALSERGMQRAEALARLLAEAGVKHVHSTNFTRTRSTAAPLASMLGLEVRIYDHQNLPSLVEHVRAQQGRHLIVGHSNTTPQMVALLGGEAGEEIDEKSEYDRLYLVTIDGTGQVSTLLLRYGLP